MFKPLGLLWVQFSDSMTAARAPECCISQPAPASHPWDQRASGLLESPSLSSVSVYNERLQRLGQRAAQLIEKAEDLDESTRDLVYLTVLAVDFDYQVKNGGFGQLIYNLGRDRLEQCDGMLRAVGAPVALSFYVRAATRCAEDLVDFEQFLADFTASTKVGQDLMLLSVEYLRGDTSFDDEITDFLDGVDARL